MANGTATLPMRPPTANDRLKDSFNSWFWGSLAAAAVIHFALIAFFPEMQAEDVSVQSDELQQVDIIQQVEIPPPPEQIVRPAVPVLSTNIDISEDITIGETTFEENPVSELPPPPTGGGVDVSKQPVFTPYEVQPELKNRSQLARILEKYYPPMLRDAGIGGTVTLWFFINESGVVENTRVQESSGYPALDEAAQKAASELRFSPALNRDQKVPVWVQLPITFKVR